MSRTQTEFFFFNLAKFCGYGRRLYENRLLMAGHTYFQKKSKIHDSLFRFCYFWDSIPRPQKHTNMLVRSHQKEIIQGLFAEPSGWKKILHFLGLWQKRFFSLFFIKTFVILVLSQMNTETNLGYKKINIFAYYDNVVIFSRDKKILSNLYQVLNIKVTKIF